MKKQLFLILLIMIILCSCTPKNPTTRSESETNKMPLLYSDFFDLDYENKPSDDQMNLVTKGMPFYDVVKIIGKPHSFADNISNGQTFKWITQEGNVYYLFFVLNYDIETKGMSIGEFNRYTVAYDVPGMVGINLLAGSRSSNKVSYVIDDVNYYSIIDYKGNELIGFFTTEPSHTIDETSKIYRISNDSQVYDVTSFCTCLEVSR